MEAVKKAILKQTQPLMHMMHRVKEWMLLLSHRK